MKKIILLFTSIISIAECFAQKDTKKNQISIDYTNSYTEGDYLYFVEGERICFTLDSTKKYQTIKYEQNTDSYKSKIKKGKGGFAFMLNDKLNTSKIPPISKNDIDGWAKSLREENYKKHDFSLKEHFKSLTDEDIINVAKKTSQFKKFNSESDLRQKLEQHFQAIKELKDLDEFIIISETRNEYLTMNDNSKGVIFFDYCNHEGKNEFYRIFLTYLEDSFSPVLSTRLNMELLKNEIIAKNYNLDIYWLAYKFLPSDSLIRNKFDIEKIYINWFLKNKI
jgi:ribosomal protein S13